MFSIFKELSVRSRSMNTETADENETTAEEQEVYR